jgi:hypothetical protein
MHTSSAPRRASKSALEFGAGVDRLAVRDDHVLEGQLQQRAQRRQRSYDGDFQMRNSPPGAVNASAKTMARCSDSHNGVSLRPRPS